MRALLTAGLAYVALAQAVEAGAWTLDRGHLQMFTGATVSHATRRFDSRGAPFGNIVFNKLLAQSLMEYGLTDAVTLFAAPEYVVAETNMSHADVTRIHSEAVEAGIRILLLTRIGMLSLQTSGKSAGAFGMSTAAGDEAGRQWELRLLYGQNFKVLGRDVFFDVQAAERWISRPRPNEFDLDATAGLWFSRNYLVMFQSFNMVSNGAAIGRYEHYRLHKLQASLVQRITPRWSLQAGYFFASAGRNIVKEQGFVTTIWYRT